ncbi:hypothetical protein ZIOFF_018407 [Zingiber officinale]|uniref:Amino acid transporter transmembrane domain-containing protein n=1 Tax=Zingiber officinale TaxID=94328 RepID=A0A8J5LAW7_ZINOF|nr:hypothetical protein ZIOFF_018407 [Zingiber officinale]
MDRRSWLWRRKSSEKSPGVTESSGSASSERHSGEQKLLYLGFQATMPSIFKHPAHVPMWRGAKVAYLLIAMCLFPIAIGGFWAYGNLMPQGGILNALYIYHSHDIPRGLLATTYLLVVFNCLSSFQIYSMPVFDSFEAALPFLSSLAGILGGLTLPKGKTLELEKSVENLNEQLSSVRSESNAKDDLLAKQAKVTEEAISGWEKAEARALALQKQLDDALFQKKMAEERLVEQDTELQEFRQQLIY